MSPVQFVSMDDFYSQKLLPGEPLSVFVHELKRLMDQAMPEMQAAVNSSVFNRHSRQSKQAAEST